MKIYKIAQENKTNYYTYYTEEIAKNPNTSPEILKKILEHGNDDWISEIAASNPNCPPDVLRKILEKGYNDWISCAVSKNLNCPPEALEMVLKRGYDDRVSWNASQNPNCPALAKINWMRAVGKIGKEDPSKHIIEKEEVKEDEDLKKLRALISKSNSWHKKSQLNEDYYDLRTASNTNTSPEILKKILEQVYNDWISCSAARNPNCPPEALEMVLNRGNDNAVSWNAAHNPNCPALAKINWMRAVGQIGKEDPTKHIIEKEEIKEDEDLKKLRDLISKNMNWYKKSQLMKNASMNVMIPDYKYPRKKDTVLDIAYLLMDYLEPFFNKLTGFELEYWKKNRIPDFITSDGDDYDKETGTINVYLKGLPERTYPILNNIISKALTKEGFQFTPPIIENSNMYESKVMRIKITNNPYSNQNNQPPELNLANDNAILIFQKILGYDLSESYAEFPIFDLMHKINKLTNEKIEENERPWSRDWGKGKAELITGEYNLEQIQRTINKIKEIANWALQHGYKRLSIG